MKKYVVLWTNVGDGHRKGKVVSDADLGGSDLVELHLSRGAIREATPEESELEKVHLATDKQPSATARTLEEKIRELTAREVELLAKNQALTAEVQTLRKGVIEVAKPDKLLAEKLAEQGKVIADLRHRLQHGVPLAE